MITSHDVAKLANVSQTTVSRAFRDDCYIDPQTRQKVLDAAKKLGYFPNYSAKSLKNKQSKIIGLLLASYDNKFYTTVTKAIESHMHDKGYRFMLAFSDEKPEKERKYLESFISSRVDGIIYMPVTPANEDLLHAARQFNIAVLQFTRSIYDQLDTYLIDDENGMFIATRHLLNMGHRRILVMENLVNKGRSPKIDGYRRAMNEYGVGVDENNILYFDPEQDMVSDLAYAISDSRATAIVASNNLFSISTLRACRRLSLRIPEDISFISYDDNEFLDFMHIDSVAHPIDEIGKQLSELLIDRITLRKADQDAPAVHKMAKPYLVVRNSVKRI